MFTRRKVIFVGKALLAGFVLQYLAMNNILRMGFSSLEIPYKQDIKTSTLKLASNTSSSTSSVAPITSVESFDVLMNKFGLRSAIEDNKYNDSMWTPSCQIHNADALDALKRVKTGKCRQELSRVACLAQENKVVPDFIPSKCSRFIQNSSVLDQGGIYLGCYEDNFGFRLLGEFVRYDWRQNTPSACIRMCSSAGYAFAGVQFGRECFCGHSKPGDYRKKEEHNCHMPCSGKGEERCGGSLYMDMYRTGITIRTRKDFRKPVDQVRIVFFLTVSGKAVRQIRRLIRMIYKSHHFYYIHVDERDEWLQQQLLVLEHAPNIKLARQRFSTFWASNTLLYLLLNSFREILHLGWAFNYIMNISESDMLIKPLEQFEEFLGDHNGANFVSIGGGQMTRFHEGQGMLKTFYNCENYMYRVGDRNLPFGLQWVGGSDWVILHKDFVHYLVYSQDLLMKGLIRYFFYSIMAPESFFHTALVNSRFCESYENENFRFINWNKAKDRGACSCTRSIDWCGCSPHNIRSDALEKVKNIQKGRNLFFARKFEALVDQEIMNYLESTTGSMNSSTTGWNNYWQNQYNAMDTDQESVMVGRLASLVVTQYLGQLTCSVKLLGVEEVTTLMTNNTFKGSIIQFHTDHGLMELLVKPHQQFSVKNKNKIRRVITFFQVGSSYDVKEKIFRNKFGAFGTQSALILVIRFDGMARSISVLVDLTYSLYGPDGKLKGKVRRSTPWNVQEEKVSLSELTDSLEQGVWGVEATVGVHPLASIKFMVLDQRENLRQPERVREFYSVESVCSVFARPVCQKDVDVCGETSWSSLAEDPKSKIVF